MRATGLEGPGARSLSAVRSRFWRPAGCEHLRAFGRVPDRSHKVDILHKVYLVLAWSLTPDTLNSSFAAVAQIRNANIVLADDVGIAATIHAIFVRSSSSLAVQQPLAQVDGLFEGIRSDLPVGRSAAESGHRFDHILD